VSAGVPAAPRFDTLAERVSERANPVLVKEVRQSLRSTFFRVVFLISLVLTTCVAVGMLAFAGPIRDAAGPRMLGSTFFSATLGATAFGAAGLVPFSAFASMNAESDQNALELLQLSNLRPLSIVLGKLLTAAIVAVLVVAVDVPFAFLAWSMGGVDPWQAAVSVASLLGFSVCLSAVAIAVSSLTHTRWVRVMLMVVFGFFVVTMGQYAGLIVFGLAAAGAGSVPVPFVAIGACTLAILLDLTATAVAFACDRLAHREESHSTPLRYVAAVTAIGGGIVAAAWKLMRPVDDEALFVLGVVLLLAALPLFLCCTEEERLPLGPRARPPRSGPLGLVSALRLAGGGRGAALATLLVLAVAFLFTVACALAGSVGADDLLQGLILCAYAWIYLLLPSGFLSFLTRYRGGRLAARALVVLFPIGAFLLVTLVLFFASGFATNAHPIEHIANPFHVLARASERDGDPLPSLIGVGLVALVTAAVNAPRIFRGWSDVARAQAERDARLAVAPAPR
jgi:ABC-type transport system involved in multi-copper enzyme maturation permease subunit